MSTKQALSMQGPRAWSEGAPSRSPSMMGAINSRGPSISHLGRYAMYDLDGDGHVSMEEIVTATFKNLFPDSFQSVLEVKNHKVSRLILSSRCCRSRTSRWADCKCMQVFHLAVCKCFVQCTLSCGEDFGVGGGRVDSG